MNTLVRKYFQEDVHYEKVLILSEQSNSDWMDVRQKVPDMPRGWFELSCLPAEDRITFICDFWLRTLPFHPVCHASIQDFFASLDDVGVVLTKKNASWIVQLVYSLGDNSSFFRGLVPASESACEELMGELSFAFPKDWVAFTKIHNGFGKLSELELLKVEDIPGAKRRVMEMMLRAEHFVKSGDILVDPGSLAPFFEVIGMNSFQCFYADWYPSSEMGNVYFSGIDYTLSNISCQEIWGENGAFPTFTEWLVSYLEGMSVTP